MDKRHIYFFTLILLLVLLQTFSCKKECSETLIIHLRASDTTAVNYRGNDTLTFLITDSSGNILDTFTFSGSGHKVYLHGGHVQHGTCPIIQKLENLKVVYKRVDDTLTTLSFFLVAEEHYTNFRISVAQGFYYQQNYTYNLFVNGDFFEDSVKSLSNVYHNVLRLPNPPEEWYGGYTQFHSAYFGKYDGLIMIEEYNNRIWHRMD